MNWSELWKTFPTACKVVPALVPTHLKRRIISLVVFVFLPAGSARAQTGDWQAVKNLMSGTRISVKTQHRYHCVVESVTDDELICGAHAPFREVVLTIRRSEVREIRIAPHPNQAKDAWIGAGIGAGAGAIAAGTMAAEAPGRNYPGFHAFVGGLGGAAGGALAGATVPIFEVVFQRGKIIYKQ